MADRGARSIRSVRLESAKLDALLDRLDEESESPSMGNRRHERFRHRVKSCVVYLTQPGSSVSTPFLVPTRDLSAGGISFLHGGFVHTNTRCTIQLITSHGTWVEVDGNVVRCRHLEGLIHEVGVCFTEEIFPGDFCTQAMKTRVLLVDDDPSSLRLASALLKRQRADIDTAQDGQQAIDAAMSNVYDVILMDIEMPVKDGFAATKELRDKGYSGVIVAVTARTQPDDRSQCLQSGFDDYFAKPFTQKALAGLFDRLRQEPLLSSFHDDANMTDLIDEFVTELPQRIRELEKTLVDQNLAKLETATRSLKGDAGGYGFDPIAEAATALEAGLREQQTAEVIKKQLAELTNWCMLARSSKRTDATADQPVHAAANNNAK